MNQEECKNDETNLSPEEMSDLIDRLVNDVVDKDNQDEFKNRLKKQLKAKWLK